MRKTMKTTGRMLIFCGIALFLIHAFLYLTRGTVYFFPLIIPVEALLKVTPYGDEMLQWLLFPKSLEGLNKAVFVILNHLPIWVIVLLVGIILWVAGKFTARPS